MKSAMVIAAIGGLIGLVAVSAIMTAPARAQTCTTKCDKLAARLLKTASKHINHCLETFADGSPDQDACLLKASDNCVAKCKALDVEYQPVTFCTTLQLSFCDFCGF